MTREEALKLIEHALHQYSTWFIDWEEMYNNPKYKPDFPSDLLKANDALKFLKEVK